MNPQTIKQPIQSGILLVDKPSGITSHDVVSRLRRVTGVKSIGHCGTLDPLATGLMIMLIGEGTKLSDHLLKAMKSYEVLVQFGLKTDSWDVDGKVLEQEEVELIPSTVSSEALKLQGDGEYEVPVFSAIKIKGKKLYEYAREEKEIEVPKRPMSFFDVKVLEAHSSTLRASLSCKKGGYIRSWAYTLGKNVNTWGTVKELRRTASYPYKIEQSVLLDDVPGEYWSSPGFVSISDCLSDWKTLTVAGKDLKLMTNGQIPNELKRRLNFDQKQVNASGQARGIKIVNPNGKLVALLDLQPKRKQKISRIFN